MGTAYTGARRITEYTMRRRGAGGGTGVENLRGATWRTRVARTDETAHATPRSGAPRIVGRSRSLCRRIPLNIGGSAADLFFIFFFFNRFPILLGSLWCAVELEKLSSERNFYLSENVLSMTKYGKMVCLINIGL